MKVRHAIIAVLALAVLAGPLMGCRSSRRTATPQAPVAQVPPTARTYVAPAPSYTPARPQPPAALPPAPSGWGSPDAPVAMDGPETFPAPVSPPVASAPEPDPTAAATTAAILEERRSRQEVDQQIVAIQERLRQAQQNLAQGPPAASPAPQPGGGVEQATRFASALKASGAGEIEQTGSLVVVRFTDAFQPGSEQLRKDARITTALLAAANELAKTPGARVEVIGHSDGTPLNRTKNRWGTNVNLSRERAQTVATELSKHGVPATRIGVNGRGSVEPLVFPEKTAQDRARNRRVEIHVRF